MDVCGGGKSGASTRSASLMQHLLLLAGILSLSLYIVVLHRVRIHPQWYLSDHIAADTMTIQISRWLLVGIAVTLSGWFFGWYVSTHETLLIVRLCVVLSGILCVGVAFVPLRGATKQLHHVLAFSMALTFPIIEVGLGWVVGGMMLMFCAVIAAVQLTLLLLPIWKVMRRWTLYLQAAYIGLYGVVLALVTYG